MVTKNDLLEENMFLRSILERQNPDIYTSRDIAQRIRENELKLKYM